MRKMIENLPIFVQKELELYITDNTESVKLLFTKVLGQEDSHRSRSGATHLQSAASCMLPCSCLSK